MKRIFGMCLPMLLLMGGCADYGKYVDSVNAANIAIAKNNADQRVAQTRFGLAALKAAAKTPDGGDDMAVFALLAFGKDRAETPMIAVETPDSASKIIGAVTPVALGAIAGATVANVAKSFSESGSDTTTTTTTETLAEEEETEVGTVEEESVAEVETAAVEKITSE